MGEGRANSWAADGTAECPVGQETQCWVEASMLWFGEQFGAGPLRPDPVLQPARFLNAREYSALPAQISAITGTLCDLMQVDGTGIRFEIFDGSEAKTLAEKKSGRSREVGHFRVEGRPAGAEDQLVDDVDTAVWSDIVASAIAANYELRCLLASPLAAQTAFGHCSAGR